MEISGRIVDLMSEFTTQGGKKKFGFILETNAQYPQKLPFEVWGEERWQQLGVVVGTFVSVSFDISGREWNGRYFVSLNAWKVSVIDSNGASSSAPQEAVPNGVVIEDDKKGVEVTQGDLPF